MKKRNFQDKKYIKWRNEVKKRDKHKCRWPKCNSKRRLQAHHIRRWADSISVRYDVGNGITLCKAHHDSIKGKERYYESFFLAILRLKDV